MAVALEPPALEPSGWMRHFFFSAYSPLVSQAVGAIDSDGDALEINDCVLARPPIAAIDAKGEVKPPLEVFDGLWEAELARHKADPAYAPSVAWCLWVLLKWRMAMAGCCVVVWVAGGLVGPVVMERLTETLETGGTVSWGSGAVSAVMIFCATVLGVVGQAHQTRMCVKSYYAVCSLRIYVQSPATAASRLRCLSAASARPLHAACLPSTPPDA